MRKFGKFVRFIIAGIAGSAVAAAQDTLTPPVPLTSSPRTPLPGLQALTEAAARRAQDLGISLLAVDLYRQARDLAGADREKLTLALSTALLDAGRAEEAHRVLEEMPEPHSAGWHLRAGLAALQMDRRDDARANLAQIREHELLGSDQAWFWFFQGQLADLALEPDRPRAREFYRRAEKAAPTEVARARIQLERDRGRMRIDSPREAEATLKGKREKYEQHQGTQLGYRYAEEYAVALHAAGQSPLAVSFLQGVLGPIQREERDWWDRLRVLLGVIGDKSRTGAGRVTLGQVVESGANRDFQRQALHLLAVASPREPERGHFRSLLQRTIEMKPDHPLKESLLFHRAQLALSEKEFALAEEDVGVLLKQFPRSPLRAHAFGVLTQSAWDQRRFRQAADYARKASEALLNPSGESRGTVTTPRHGGVVDEDAVARARADLGVLEAEAWFRAGVAAGDPSDFRLAADAYGAVLREGIGEIDDARLGTLMFQRVYAEIKSGSGAASQVLDALGRDSRFDLENRWSAEWELVRALQLRGDAGRREALARANRLLLEPATTDSTLKPDIRARMMWLQARLSLEVGEAEQAIRYAETFLEAPLDLPGSAKTDIMSVMVLLKAQAEFALGREPVAFETLKRLRADFPATEAAVSSYLIESEHYAAKDRIDEARNRLISLTDNPAYKESEYVPFALFRLALLSERLGTEQNLREANKRIEDLIELALKSPRAGQGDLIFAARLKQGDILRKLSDFPAAQVAYEDLVNRYPRRQDVVIAQLALAATHNAQSGATPDLHAEKAQLMFEQLRDRVDAPRDVRVEAGYNLGALLLRRGKLEEAARVWWRDVITPFFLEEKVPLEADAKRPFWLARTLRELGELQETLKQFEEAKATYRLLLDNRFPYGGAFARDRLKHLGLSPTP